MEHIGKRLLFSLEAVLLTFMLTSCAYGITYYVSPTSGNDSNDGKSNDKPWQTLYKCNATTMADGDIVLMSRDDICRDKRLDIQAGVTYGAYGIGAKPILYGSTERNTAAHWVDQGSNIWRHEPAWTTTGAELATNPSMDANTTGWTLTTADTAMATLSWTNTGGEYQAGTGGAKIVCEKAGDDDTDIIMHGTVNVEARKYYLFSAQIKAEKAAAWGVDYNAQRKRDGMRLMPNNSFAWDYVHMSTDISHDLTTTFAECKGIYVATDVLGESTTAEISFVLGNLMNATDQTTVYIDEVSFKECADQDIVGGTMSHIHCNNDPWLAHKKWTYDLEVQGDYAWYDGIWRVDMYSVGNPATYYDDIEVSWEWYDNGTQMLAGGTDDWTVENLKFEYIAGNSIICYGYSSPVENWIVQDCDFINNGGHYEYNLDVGMILGGGGEDISIDWDNKNAIVRRCTASQRDDDFIGFEGNNARGNAITWENIKIYNNTIGECTYGIFVGIDGSTYSHVLNGIYIENNTFYNAGYCWNADQNASEVTDYWDYDDIIYPHLQFYDGTGCIYSDCYVRNNVFYDAKSARPDGTALTFKANPSWTAGELANWTVTNNVIYQKTDTAYVMVDEPYSATSEDAAWVAYSDAGWESMETKYGWTGNYFNVDPGINTTTLIPTSATSGCVEVGTTPNNDIKDDYRRLPRPQGAEYDAGAYEFGEKATYDGVKVDGVKNT